MTIEEARKIEYDFERIEVPTEEDVFLFTEAMDFIIRETKDPDAMMHLGGWYYDKRQFDLALKYYEMAETQGSLSATICLGYIWYYGRTGVRDFDKAYKYFSKGKEAGDIVSAYKVADCYKNGYGVKQDENKYKEIIEELYPLTKKMKYVSDPVPEIMTRLARIRAEEGKEDEAYTLYLNARSFLAERIKHNAFFGNLNIMRWTVEDIYKLVPFDPNDFDFFDLFYLLQKPCKVTFRYVLLGRMDSPVYEIEAVEEDGEVHIHYGDKWYRTVDDFMGKATVEGSLMTHVFEDIYNLEVKFK